GRSDAWRPPATTSSPRLSRSYRPSSTWRACSQASREPSMVTWLPRESATTPSRRSISARCCPYWPNSVEASRLSSNASTTWVAPFSAVAAGGMSEPLSVPRVRNASALQARELGCGISDEGPRDVADQAVRSGGGDGDRGPLADQPGRCHDLHGLQVGRAADQLAGQAARLLEQHVERAADAGAVERGLMAVDLGLQPRQPLDLGVVFD